MNLSKVIKQFLGLIIFVFLMYGCEEDDCTKMVNIPQWDPIEMTFVDNFQEVPCDFDEPVDEPVN